MKEVLFVEFYVNHPIPLVLAGLLVAVVPVSALFTIGVARILYKRGAL